MADMFEIRERESPTGNTDYCKVFDSPLKENAETLQDFEQMNDTISLNFRSSIWLLCRDGE